MASEAPVNSNIYEVAEAHNKRKDLESYLENLPRWETYNNLVNFLNNLSAEDLSDFFIQLYSRGTINDIKKSDYISGVYSKLFQLEPKGLGKAELFLAALIKNCKISGGGQSFDMQIGEQRYEVKDYREQESKPIRLGTKGKVTRFTFWNEIIKTLRIIYTNHDYISDIVDVSRILSRYEFILSGELNKSDIRELEHIYLRLHQCSKINTTGYSSVKFFGTNKIPVHYSMNTIDFEHSDTFTITITCNSQKSAKINNSLRRLSYVRNPQQLQLDITSAISCIVDKNVPFIVFRPNGPIITTDFSFSSISQGGMFIHEN